MSTAEGSPPDDGPARSPAAAENSADERYGHKFTTRDETPQEDEGKGGGRDGGLWYGEEGVRGLGGSRQGWFVAGYEIAQARRAGGIACAVRRRHNVPVLGLRQDGPLPRGLTETPTGDEQFDQRYVVGAAGGDQVNGERPWASRLFTAELTGWLLEQPYGEHGTDATCFQLQGDLACVYAAGWPGTADELDAFCDRAARIAAEVERVAHEASPG